MVNIPMRGEYLRCRKTSCLGKDSWVRRVVQYMIRLPDNADKYARATSARVVWYCCHCNSTIDFHEVVINLPDPYGDMPSPTQVAKLGR